jgi:low temperature requirement protein LtrA
MSVRDTGEAHRVSTPLELFFDLCFVVAVSQVAAELHHAVSAGHAHTAVVSYFAAFFAIWWAWMNFTWFASAYDVDDVPYRIAVLVQITGSLVLAAGVPRAFEHQDFTLVAAGYTIARAALVTQWLRAAAGHPEGRSTALRYAAGLAVVQTLWVCWLLVPHGPRMALFPVIALLDVGVPLWAERTGSTAWHPHHISERYGLFTLIVLGESVLSATTAVQGAVDGRHGGAELYVVAAGGLLTVFAMWWLYFAKPAAHFLTSSRAAFVWGYGHYAVFGSAAAVGAGLAVNVDRVTGEGGIGAVGAAAAVTIPVAVFLLLVWLLHVRPHRLPFRHSVPLPATALLVLAATFSGQAVLATGLLATAAVAAGVALAERERVHRRGRGGWAAGE